MLTWMGAGMAGALATPCAAPAPSVADLAPAIPIREPALASVDVTRCTFPVAAERTDWALLVAVARAVEHRFDLLALAPGTRVTVWRSGTTLLALLVDRTVDEGGPFFAQRAVPPVEPTNQPPVVLDQVRAVALVGDHGFHGVTVDPLTSSSATWNAALPADDFVDDAGRALTGPLLARPVRYLSISSRVGMREHPLRHRQSFHAGTDYAAAVGTPVVALGDGVVAKVKRSWTAGKFVVVRFNDGERTYEAKYLHLSAFAPGLAAGTRVEQGQLIGRTGATGRVTGPHLHFELRTAQGLPLDLAAQHWPGDSVYLAADARQILALRRSLLLGVAGRGAPAAWSPLSAPSTGLGAQRPCAPTPPAQLPNAPVNPSRAGMSVSTHAPSRRRRRRVAGPPPLFDLDAKSLQDPLILRTLQLAATFA